MLDPDNILDEVLDENQCPIRQLVDERWVWLPAVLVGRGSVVIRPRRACSRPAQAALPPMDRERQRDRQ
jgi:hypothetical protein